MIRNYYPTRDRERLTNLTNVIMNRSTWTPDQLSNELPAITHMTGRLGGPTNEDDLLQIVSNGSGGG